MLTVEQAIHAILASTIPLSPANLPLQEALGLILTENVSADLDLPPFDKALMDGYAVHTADLAAGQTRFQVVEEITAGRTSKRPLGRGEAVAIMTGAPLPAQADAVVMVERTRRDGSLVVIDDTNVRPGNNILCRGRELRTGEVVLTRGTVLTPARLGLLAAVGRVAVTVVPRPSLAIVPTGDELVDPGTMPGPGQIRNSNATMLASFASQAGASSRIQPIAPDEPKALKARLREAMEFDLVLVTGGVSAGRLDLVPEALEALGVTRVFHKVRVKPGKPIWFGIGPVRANGSSPLVFGLPGNPVSGLIGFLLFVRPAIDALLAKESPFDRTIEAKLARPFTHAGDRPTYHPARRSGGNGSAFEIEPLDWAGSADLRTVAGSGGFAVFPAGDRTYAAGEIVRFLPLE